MKKNKLMLFAVVFCISIIFTYPAFVNSHSLDSYCTMYNGYNDTAAMFLQNGRIISALAFFSFSLLNFPFDSLSFVSAFLMDLFISLAVCKLYFTLKNNIKIEKTLTKIILLSGLFLLFYNPLIMEVLMLDEGFVIALGILFITLSSVKIFEEGWKNYLIALLYAIIGVICYQGIACYLFLILILLCLLENNFKNK